MSAIVRGTNSQIVELKAQLAETHQLLRYVAYHRNAMGTVLLDMLPEEWQLKVRQAIDHVTLVEKEEDKNMENGNHKASVKKCMFTQN